MKYISYILVQILLITGLVSQAQSDLVTSGPMLGYSEMKEVAIWLQTKSKLRYIQVGCYDNNI